MSRISKPIWIYPLLLCRLKGKQFLAVHYYKQRLNSLLPSVAHHQFIYFTALSSNYLIP